MFNAHIRSGDIEKIMENMGVSPEGVELMGKKGRFYVIKLEDVPIKDAIILKQEALAVGGECALGWGVLTLNVESTDALLMLTERQMEILSNKMRYQPFNGKRIADELDALVKNFKKREYTLKAGDKEIRLPVAIMGILNVTPDSFSDGGLYYRTENAVERALQMLDEGAKIIDIGGESSRPGSPRVSVEEELKRVLPVLREIRDRTDAIISVDTYKPEVADKVLNEGADMINDIYGLRKEGMAEVIADHGAGVVIMHMQGDPENMQNDPKYEDVIADIMSFLRTQADKAINAGIDENSIVIDPGIGFGKTVEHNLRIINELNSFRSLGYPLLLGASRKSFIGKILDLPVEDRLEGSLAVASIAVEKGASILRVHDVKETWRAVEISKAIMESKV
jgi:dihydropteroate synthase